MATDLLQSRDDAAHTDITAIRADAPMSDPRTEFSELPGNAPRRRRELRDRLELHRWELADLDRDSLDGSPAAGLARSEMPADHLERPGPELETLDLTDTLPDP